MKKISSNMTRLQKRIFPQVWFGILGFFIIFTGYLNLVSKNPPPIQFIVMPLLMSVFGYVIFKKTIFDLADEVFDAGDFLLVRNNKKEERVQFDNIKNISYSIMVRPHRVTITLRNPGIFGNEISFMPQVQFINTFNIFQKNPMIEDLINRVDNSRIK